MNAAAIGLIGVIVGGLLAGAVNWYFDHQGGSRRLGSLPGSLASNSRRQKTRWLLPLVRQAGG
jgi:hypothetical protein